MRPDWTFVVTDSLEKVFADEHPRAADPNLRGFLGEHLAAQVAFLPPSAQSLHAVAPLRVELSGPIADAASVSTVELVPATLLAFDDHDSGYLRDSPGLYPDLLKPLPPGEVVPPAVGYWRALWIDLVVQEKSLAGQHDLTVRIVDANTGHTLFTEELPVTIHPLALPELDIVNTHWLHADCLSDHYGLEPFGDEHWRVLEHFIASAAQMRVNSVLTPTWTPPLDTAVDHTRPMVQLISITDDGGGYRFDFSLLGRWLELCAKYGMRTVEIAHLFTQWGATATPAIYVQTPGGLEQRFGWHVPATDPSYRELLVALLPALRAYLEENWEGGVLFHISDEPRANMLTDYAAARGVVDDLLEGAVIADALSDLSLVSEGAVQTPIVATDHVQPFLDAGLNPWVYYCVSQNRDVANRFISMPSARNRVLGRQLFLGRAPGFLHWGFNFYFSQYSLRSIDPFADTSAGGAFPAGDPFVVYPAPDGTAWPSLRHRVFAQAMDDHRALQLLRDLTDEQTARECIDPDGTLTYSRYSLDPQHFHDTRRAVDERILAAADRT